MRIEVGFNWWANVCLGTSGLLNAWALSYGCIDVGTGILAWQYLNMRTLELVQMYLCDMCMHEDIYYAKYFQKWLSNWLFFCSKIFQISEQKWEKIKWTIFYIFLHFHRQRIFPHRGKKILQVTGTEKLQKKVRKEKIRGDTKQTKSTLFFFVVLTSSNFQISNSENCGFTTMSNTSSTKFGELLVHIEWHYPFIRIANGHK